MADARRDGALEWWRSSVLYQIYIRSFADSNGDGIGDLGGVLQRLDHLAWLGVDAIWLSPVGPSPNADWGYDVADYCAVHPDYGTLADLDALIGAAHQRGMDVLLDLVPNHTSDRHPWFVDARSSRDAAHRNWYVWADQHPDGSPPNNWVGSFGGPAWSLDDQTGQCYLHNFLPEQPDLNWWNEEVRQAFDDILAFWWERGIAGFRIDVCNMIIKDRELRDNPPATEDDPFVMQMFGQRPFYNSNRPEVHDVLRRWRTISDSYDRPRLLLGETNVERLETLVSFYGTGSDELHLAFNFPFIEAPFEAKALSEIFERTAELIPGEAWPVWTGSNHDVSRLATRWAQGDGTKIRLALLMLLTLRGTPVLYQGDEIGLIDGVFSNKEDLLDPVGLRYWPHYVGRDPERTPMPWDRSPNAGFTGASVKPWLPMADTDANVADQRDDPGSVLHLVRAVIELRRCTPDLTSGDYRRLPATPEVWMWRRGDATVVALNFSSARQQVTLPDGGGRVVLSTRAERQGAGLDADLDLEPWEGAVLSAS